MKHLKIFETVDAFDTEKAKLEKPWVVLTEDDKNVHIMESGEPTPTYEYVDLGLPSKLKWAKCNIGAENPYEYGDYYQWGAVKPNTEGTPYDWAHAPFNNGASDFDETYFNAHKDEWLVNNILKPEYDAAVAAGKGRMPTTDEYKTLYVNTYWQWVESGTDVVVKVINDDGTITSKTVTYPAGYFVYKVKDDTHKGQMNTADISALYDYNYHPAGEASPAKEADIHIFLPASGYASGTGVNLRGYYGYYWSSSLNASNSSYGHRLHFDSGNINPQLSGNRSSGFCVRSVSEN